MGTGISASIGFVALYIVISVKLVEYLDQSWAPLVIPCVGRHRGRSSADFVFEAHHRIELGSAALGVSGLHEYTKVDFIYIS